jgi:CheY-like chemotaxis protein
MSLRVLVADDEPLTAEMLALMLAFRGHEVVCANDGAEALARARELKPDVVLLDVLMPELRGDAVARRLRADPELAGCPIVLMSSVDEAEVRWRDAGAEVFLQKPFDLRQVAELVERLLPAGPGNRSRGAGNGVRAA